MTDASGAFLGREIRLTPNDSDDQLVLGVRSKTINLIGEALDITSDDDDSWQRFLTEAPRKGISMTVDGIAKGGFMKAVAEAGNVLALTDYSAFCPQVGTWTGNWVVSGISISGETDGLATFSATINSNGELTFDPDADGNS